MFDKTTVGLAVALLFSVFAVAEGATFNQVDFSSQADYSWSGTNVPRVGILLPGAPVGNVTLGGVPFNIKSNGSGNQAWNAAYSAGGTTGENDPGGAQSITMNVNDFGATDVYTLINTWHGQGGPSYFAWITFTGSAGAVYTKDLVGSVDIRDFNNFTNTNSINGTTTTNVYSTPSDGEGLPGRLDMQDILLPAAFATQTLTSIQLVDNGGPNFQRTILDGVTVASVPEPSTLALFIVSAVGLLAFAWRRKRMA